MTQKIINCTPHAVNVNGRVFPPSGIIVRVSQAINRVGSIDGVPAFQAVFSDVVDAPAPEDGTYFIVSQIVKERAKRADFVSPGELVRDDAGRVIGCKGFFV